MNRALRIAMLAHSTIPRGGVVHALQLGEALAELGHQVTLFAPDATGRGFFRAARIATEAFAVARASSGMTAMVEQRVGDYVAYLERRGVDAFDVFHCHDGISGNALATLKERGGIAGFLRTVHHLDRFADPQLMELQRRSVDSAEAIFTVSEHWRAQMRQAGREATVVGNGVDTCRFQPARREIDTGLAARMPEGDGPLFLSVGGVEARKNTVLILKAFAEVRAVLPKARLVIAGGVSLLDHRGYEAQFREALAAMPQHAPAVHLLGEVQDVEMPALYRAADALVFASVREGFGLVVLEAMACGLPVVLSSIPPFTEYVPRDAAIWCDPTRPASIGDAMVTAVNSRLGRQCVEAGLAVAARHDWRSVAERHLPVYVATIRKREPAHA